jgi:hypothetical protein
MSPPAVHLGPRSYSRFSCGCPRVMAGCRPPTSLGRDGEGRSRGPQRLPSTWVQMAIIPINKASEARAAASWITALNMTSSPGTEREHSSSFVLKSSDKSFRRTWCEFKELGGSLQVAPDKAHGSGQAISVILPSRKVTRLSMRAARSMLCVAIMAARPEALTNCESALKTCSAV